PNILARVRQAHGLAPQEPANAQEETPEQRDQGLIARQEANGETWAGREDQRWWAEQTLRLKGDISSVRSFLLSGPRWLPSGRERERLAVRFRDIIGNPFRPVLVDSRWLTGNVVAIARGIYDEYAFDRMPILADALEDAGCTNPDILDHCRELGEHVR